MGVITVSVSNRQLLHFKEGRKGGHFGKNKQTKRDQPKRGLDLKTFRMNVATTYQLRERIICA